MAKTLSKSLESILQSEDKLQEISDVHFNKYDIDGSGYIEAKEFRLEMEKLYTQLHIEMPSKREVHSIMASFDMNGDNKLDRNEYKEYVRALLQGMLDGTLGQ
uniref:EF-hand domain-containing protein n=1 Tax=Euplotes harpa TaxID=151035 RepID=A0A7S3J8U5_9SPIT|mmetsp:Transcript_26315/g.30436  ORF Transcript_26315/g.30436 Transcript_26315/m.30436 type:complete len:103 (+) Transcript_26315:41-349(+)